MVEQLDPSIALLKDVRDVAKQAGSCIIEGFLEIEATPVCYIEAEDIARMISEVRPRVVFIMSADFDPDAEIAEAFGPDDDEEPLSDRETLLEPPPECKELTKQFARYRGKTCSTFLSFMVDGAVVATVVRTSWIDDFRSQLEAVQQAWQLEAEEIAENVYRAEEADIQEKADVLAKKCGIQFRAPVL